MSDIQKVGGTALFQGANLSQDVQATQEVLQNAVSHEPPPATERESSLIGGTNPRIPLMTRAEGVGSRLLVFLKGLFSRFSGEKTLKKTCYDYNNITLWKVDLSQEQEKALGGSKDLGGHGGTFKGVLGIKGQEKQVFLKPFDGVEAKNYQLINEHCPGLVRFMPTVHGLATDTKGRQFLIMENTRISQDGKTEFKQYADIKLAGKVEGLKGKNLICDQDEMVATRGRKKNSLDYEQMKYGANEAPGFMFYKDSAVLGKMGRIFNFKESEKNLQEALNEVSSEQLRGLQGEIEKLWAALEVSDAAFIGGSVIFVQEGDKVTLKLIDPAHVQYNPEKKDLLGGEGIYCGDKEGFAARRESNVRGVAALHHAMMNIIASREN